MPDPVGSCSFAIMQAKNWKDLKSDRYYIHEWHSLMHSDPIKDLTKTSPFQSSVLCCEVRVGLTSCMIHVLVCLMSI